MADRHSLVPASYLLLEKDGSILLSLRQNTGYRDGQYTLVSGHVEEGETFTEAMIREAREEAGVDLDSGSLEIVHCMQRLETDPKYTMGPKLDNRIDVFFRVNKWRGEIVNKEPEKCVTLDWFATGKLPDNLYPYLKVALEHIANGRHFSEYGYSNVS